MKYALLIADGMNDRPVKELDGATPLEIANTPNMDNMAQRGALIGVVRNVPRGFKPGSDIAIMSMLGYDPKLFYTGRGPLEAANMGLDINDNQVAFRSNFVTVAGEKMVDYSSSHISNKETEVLIADLNKNFGSKRFKFYRGISYRNLLISEGVGDEIKTVPPHDIMGEDIAKFLPSGPDSGPIRDLMLKSRDFLSSHDVNKVRLDLGENPANMIWLWGQGRRPSFPSFDKKYGVDGFVISAVDLVNGMARLMGLKVIKVPGITGYYDTNYAAKGDYAIKHLKKHDFCFVHLEATDEAGHNGDLREKIKAIESFDRHIAGPIYNYLEKEKDYRILISSDHATPVSMRTHTEEPVAFICYGKNIKAGIKMKYFNEKNARATLVEYTGSKLIEEVLFK
jgi:2,3-bisphosphoglycerate-independent phosphoglycerate mutase